jgi:superfamily II DNA/RNA helicase
VPALSFADLGLPALLARVLARRDITVPTPIQAATLADTIAGRDVLGRGRTGSGKTYAFLLPLVARLSNSKARSRPRAPRALVLAPLVSWSARSRLPSSPWRKSPACPASRSSAG